MNNVCGSPLWIGLDHNDVLVSGEWLLVVFLHTQRFHIQDTGTTQRQEGLHTMARVQLVHDSILAGCMGMYVKVAAQ
jgi:hypothetical protein